jgi:hypothetical protein
VVVRWIYTRFGHHDQVDPEKTYIEMFDLKTRQVSQLTGSQKVLAPRWSPDGRYIVAIATGNNKLVLYDLKNKTWRPLEPDLTFGYLAWSRDSAYVYFDTFLSSDSGYFPLRISDSKIEKVADLKNARLYRSQFGLGSWTGLGPGDIPLFPATSARRRFTRLTCSFHDPRVLQQTIHRLRGFVRR